jgi:hypothetical protein
MRLKIYGPNGYLVSIDFQVVVGWKRKSRRIHDFNAQSPNGRRQLTRVNSANILDEGLASDELEGKDQTNKARFEVYQE